MSSEATLTLPVSRPLIRRGQAATRRLDVLGQFGPLASMHAALQAQGIGTPCGVVARFEGLSASELERAIAVARRDFPVLQTRLAWRRGRAVLEPQDAGAPGGVWTYELFPDAAGVWFHGRWSHAAADGRSMLRFVQALASALGEPVTPMARAPARAPARLRPMASWLPEFLADQHRPYVRMARDASARPGVSWLTAAPEERDRILDDAARDCGGFVGPLGAAAAAAFCEQQAGARAGMVSLNVPIARSDLEDLGGFGFGVGSLLLPVRVGPGDSQAGLALEIAKRTRKLAAEGFDRNLDRFLGRDPLRHRIFGVIRARRPADPAVTVSWKGRHEFGGPGCLRTVACFAEAPTLHVSAHADRNGLSISVSSRQTAFERRELLRGIADRLELRADRWMDLDQIAAAPPAAAPRRARS